MARPSIRTDEMIESIVNRISEGESLRSICRDDENPTIGTFLKWCSDDEKLSQQYARAMQIRAECVFEEMEEIADDAQNDYMDKINADGSVGDRVLDTEHVQRSKLRIDTRKWILSRMNPKKYGDKQEITAVGDAVVVVRDFTGRKKESEE